MASLLYPPMVQLMHPMFRLLHLRGLSILFITLFVARAQAQVCNDAVVFSLDEDCSLTILPDMILEGTYDLSLFTVKITTSTGQPIPNDLNASHIGLNLVATITDTTTGSYCQGTFKVVDNTKPIVDCSNFTIPCLLPDFSPGYLLSQISIPEAIPQISDNCSNPQSAYTDSWEYFDCGIPGDLFGILTRTWTAADPSGNVGGCVQTIKVTRVHADDIDFPADIQLDCSAPEIGPSNTGLPSWAGPAGPVELQLDNTSCGFGLSYTDVSIPSCGNTFSVLRTWILWDECPQIGLNPVQQAQIISVSDTLGPELLCPPNLTINANPFTCYADYDLPDIHLMDGCSTAADFWAAWEQNGVGVSIPGTLSDFPGNNLWNPDTLGVLPLANNIPIGDHTITYFANDACGNLGACTFVLTVRDDAPPLAACDEDTQVSVGINGEALVNAATFDDGSWDNCVVPEFKARRLEANDCQDHMMFHDQVKFCCGDVGDTILVVLRVLDFPIVSGPVDLDYGEPHNNDCVVKVFVKDKIKPACLPPDHVDLADCATFDPSFWLYGVPSGADNCCLVSVEELDPNYTLFDTICNRGTLIRRFQATDCYGQTSQCTQRVVFENDQYYYLKFPDDLLVNDCDTTGFYSPGPEIFGEDCEQMSISYTDEFFEAAPEACVKIERTWKVINWCSYDPNLPLIKVPNPTPHPELNSIYNLPGPLVAPPGNSPSSTIIRVNPDDPDLTDYSDFWDKDANGYEYQQIINIRDEVPPKIRSCPLIFPLQFCDQTDNDAQLWNAPYWGNQGDSTTWDLCEGRVNLAVTGEDACSKGEVNIRYLLFLDLDGDDSTETVVSSTNFPGYNKIHYNNINTLNYEGGEIREFDQRPVPPEEKYGFSIQYFTGGPTKTAMLRWTTQANPNVFVNPELPFGRHKIRWIVSDACGNETYCEYLLTIKDCLKPEIICLNGLSVNIQPSSTVTIYPSDLIVYVADNCTPAAELELSIAASELEYLDFPLDSMGNPFESIQFDCSKTGVQGIDLWVRDNEGNSGQCETYVIVQDNLGMCSSDPVSVAGFLLTEDEAGIEEAFVTMEASHPQIPLSDEMAVSTGTGLFLFQNALPYGSDAVLIPFKDDNYTNGVSTYDLVLINQHILGQIPLDGPYNMIAADANHSGSITIYDVAELRKLVLGIYSDLPDSDSWRFVDAAHSFADPNNPFAFPFPESISLYDLQSNPPDQEFIGIKIGDVNGSALPNNNAFRADTRTPFYLSLEDRYLGKHEVLEFELAFPENLDALQFALSCTDLEILDLAPYGGLKNEELALHHSGLLSVAWSRTGAAPKTGLRLTVRATRDAWLSELLALVSEPTPAMAYRHASGGAAEMPVQLRFENSGAGEALRLFQNTPNPVVEHTNIAFYLPQATDCILEISDQTGRKIYTQKANYGKGYNQEQLPVSVFPGKGVYYYSLSTDSDYAVRSLLVLD